MFIKRRLALIVVCALTLAALAVTAACAADTNTSSPSNNANTNAGNQATQNDGQSSSSASLWDSGISTESLDGIAITGEDFKQNKLTVFNVWGTWCPPCVGELPHLQEVSERFASENVQIAGILQDGVTSSGSKDTQTIDSAKSLMADAGASYLVILPDAVLASQLVNITQSFPTTYFVDSQGRIVHVVAGAKSADDWERIINEVLGSLA